MPELGERSCANGDECEVFKLPSAPRDIVPLREHVANKRDPNFRSLCILCKRYAANFPVIQYILSGRLGPPPVITHANYVRDGEYALSQCWQGPKSARLSIPVALVCHQRGYYEWVRPTETEPGHFVESGYIYPEHENQRDFGRRAAAQQNF